MRVRGPHPAPGDGRDWGLCVALVLASLWVAPASGFAHGLAPVRVDVTEVDRARYEVVLKIPTSAESAIAAPVEVRFAAHCVASRPRVEARADAVLVAYGLDCEGEGLVGHRIAVEGLGRRRTDALLTFQPLDGPSTQALLQASAPHLDLPVPSAVSGAVRRHAADALSILVRSWPLALMFLALGIAATSRRGPGLALGAAGGAAAAGAGVMLWQAVLPPAAVLLTAGFGVVILAHRLADVAAVDRGPSAAHRGLQRREQGPGLGLAAVDRGPSAAQPGLQRREQGPGLGLAAVDRGPSAAHRGLQRREQAPGLGRGQALAWALLGGGLGAAGLAIEAPVDAEHQLVATVTFFAVSALAWAGATLVGGAAQPWVSLHRRSAAAILGSSGVFAILTATWG